jgi:adenosylcobinamide-GDP ribazoletransferase
MNNTTSTPTVSPITAFLTAVQFLTRVPVPGGAMSGTMEDYQVALRASVVYFPIVGGLIGVTTGAIFFLGSQLWPPLIAAIVAIAIEACLTGAFHEDALADATDALGGGWTREQVLEILKDSRHGTYGVLALVIGVSLRIVTVATLPPTWAVLIIAASASIGRWAILWMMAMVPPIEDRHTMARDVGSQPGVKTIVLGGILPILLAIALLVWSPSLVLIALIASVILTLYLAYYFKKRVGGITGDFLGCTCYLVQLVILLVATIR